LNGVRRHLSEDLGEQNNLIAKHPEIAARLKKRMEEFHKELRYNTSFATIRGLRALQTATRIRNELNETAFTSRFDRRDLCRIGDDTGRG
jgi:hypothetical protein